jgi:hypothetical protein
MIGQISDGKKGRMQGKITYKPVLTLDRKRKKKSARVIVVDESHLDVDSDSEVCNESVRLLIASVYVLVLEALTPATWIEKNTINTILEKCEFRRSAYSKVKKIISEVYEGRKNDDQYDYNGKINHKIGRQSTIKTDREEENIIANKLELGCSFTKT